MLIHVTVFVPKPVLKEYLTEGLVWSIAQAGFSGPLISEECIGKL